MLSGQVDGAVPFLLAGKGIIGMKKAAGKLVCVAVFTVVG